MEEYLRFELAWRDYKRRKRQLWKQAVQKCTSACETEQKEYAAWVAAASNVQKPKDADLLWESVEKPAWLKKFSQERLLECCKRQARIWVEHKTQLITALEAMEAP